MGCLQIFLTCSLVAPVLRIFQFCSGLASFALIVELLPQLLSVTWCIYYPCGSESPVSIPSAPFKTLNPGVLAWTLMHIPSSRFWLCWGLSCLPPVAQMKVSIPYGFFQLSLHAFLARSCVTLLGLSKDQFQINMLYFIQFRMKTKIDNVLAKR